LCIVVWRAAIGFVAMAAELCESAGALPSQRANFVAAGD